ncbi:uridine-cytidine N-ribohydrolase [Aspergillus homomorphus CBS 101889]|uniref:Putative inosine-uridine preferring nucleoside hydrolase n=1 Tax=Aspergillus homomorphus (strain CBS 101889) TaxID=1450537 RepID=A0A395HQG7_ASPHC|nr:putative inosine-uridine preferring nucleoside hydrolase [Aspergillus homomorphus CBS 101889]RAL09990.1 putative inosine-uridine preferring nucleoside hydrolase [Aspergillus homomorphus CBS 101889]
MASTANTPTPLWLDCDPGHDDAFAILLAAHHPSLKLLGITTIHGNSSLDNTTVNATRVLEAIGRSDIPVYPGTKKPFCRPAVHAPNIHGDSGIDGTELLPKATTSPITDKNPILAMRDALLAEPKGTPWVIATGTLTNVALLFATFPEVVDHIQGLSIMGGAVGNGFTDVPVSRIAGQQDRIGNVTPFAEFNIYCDPESSQSIFSNAVLSSKTYLISLDLTHQVLANEKVRNLLRHGGDDASVQPSTLRQMLYELLIFFASTYENVFGLASGPPLHDPLAVAIILSTLNPLYSKHHPEALKFDDRNGERFAVNVVTNGLHSKDMELVGHLGQTVTKPAPNAVCIPRGVDLDAFWNLINDCLKRADELNAARKA